MATKEILPLQSSTTYRFLDLDHRWGGLWIKCICLTLLQASTACSTLACSILNVNVRYLESCAQVRVPNSKSGLPDWPFLGPDCSNLAPFNFAWTPKNILALWSFLDLFDNYNVIMLFTSLLLRELQKIVKYNSDFSTVSRYLAPKSRIWTLF